MGRTRALRNVKEVELEDIPKLTKCGLVTAFKCVESVKMESVSKLGDLKALKQEWERKKVEEEEERRKQEEERRKKEAEAVEEASKQRRKEEKERKRRAVEEGRIGMEKEEAAAITKKTAVISCKRDWDCVDKRVGVIEVSDGCCNEEGLKELDLSGFVNLRELKVGDECFMYVNEVKLIGLSELESVCIGSKSLTRIRSENDVDEEKNLWDQIDHNRHFYLKNCPKLRELRIGPWSCLDYTVIEIENVNALEVIEVGKLKENGYNFQYASLELKSILIYNE